jgi:hypothetical protein
MFDGEVRGSFRTSVFIHDPKIDFVCFPNGTLFPLYCTTIHCIECHLGHRHLPQVVHLNHYHTTVECSPAPE